MNESCHSGAPVPNVVEVIGLVLHVANGVENACITMNIILVAIKNLLYNAHRNVIHAF